MIYTYIYAFLGLGWLVFIAVALIAYVIGLIFDNDFMMSVGFTATVLMFVCGVGYYIFKLPSQKEIYNYGVEHGYTFYIDGREVDPNFIDPYDYIHINLPDDENQRIIIASTGR
jgi:predicted membrane channel-forming protein YqfA (hemolysin III family)